MGDAGLATAHAGAGPLLAANHLIILWTTLPVVGAILLGALVIALVRRWRDRPARLALSASEQLARFRVLYERGQLSAEEFGRVQALLNERLRREMDLPSAPPSDSPNSPHPTPAGSAAAPADFRALPLPPPPGSGEANGHPRPDPGKDTPP